MLCISDSDSPENSVSIVYAATILNSYKKIK